MTFDLVTVGGGITGLSAALRMQSEAPGQTQLVLESSDRCGGVLDTIYRDGYLIERAADMFTTKLPWAKQLCEETGYDDLITVNPEHRRAFLIRNGKLTPVPEGFSLLKPVKLGKMLFAPLLSVAGKCRLLYERFVPARMDESDESLASFAQRRLGREVYERLVQPLIGGIYTADPTKLSMLATLPQFPAMERQYGSLIRAAMKDSDESEKLASGARYDHFVTPRQGFRHFIDHLVSKLPAGTIRTGAKVAAIAREDNAGDDGEANWRIELEGGEAIHARRLLLTTPAHATAELVRPLDGELADELAGIPYAGSTVIVVGCRRDQFRHPLDGFGIVAPLVEKRRILAISFSSMKFAGRAPDGEVLLRVFVGGAVQPEFNALGDDELKQIACEEMQDLLGMSGEPIWTEIVRWGNHMPQYHVGHVDRVERIKSLSDRHANFAIAGAAYKGVGIPFCIRSGRAVVDRLLT
ncbi:MAG: protoporphyrinogen oxidase [Planctomycetales bacterium]|nr:protoporphyrinogen oxidase [Planctomycetales bacterium]